MIYRRLGKSGLQLSALSLGSWLTFGRQVDEKTSEELMRTAYDAGINFFDNAEGYAGGNSETVMGNILGRMKWERSTFVVSSKVFFGGAKPNQSGLSRKHVMEACHAALRRLGVEYLDLFYCHRPDKNTPIEETVFVMNDLIRQGKIFYWGTSEWSAKQIMEAYDIARENKMIPPSMEQPQYNLFHRDKVESEFSPLYSRIGLGTTIWSPLSSGLLTGKYNEGLPAGTDPAREKFVGIEFLNGKVTGDDSVQKIEKIKKLSLLAKKLDVSLPCLAIAWCLKNPDVSTVILGASKTKQLEENLHALEVFDMLTSEVMTEIETIFNNKPRQAVS